MRSLAISLILTVAAVADEMPASLALKTAANAFLASLDEQRMKKAQLEFPDEERENWHYTPRSRAGLSLAEMNDAQKNAAVGLVTALLSEKGSYKAAQIISLEAVLAGLENNSELRDPEKYYTTVFGEPGDTKGWGFRVEGHHLSLNVTVVGDRGISITPAFMGANPAVVAEGESKGMRPLAAEEDLARALAAALLESGKGEVVFDRKPPREILTGEDRVARQLAPVGIPADAMSEAQREALFELIGEYAGRYRSDIATAEMARITKLKPAELRFGWAGSVKAGEAYYYRIQGPSFLIETANTQNDANHIHTVWRDLGNDFGRDLLREHLEDHD